MRDNGHATRRGSQKASSHRACSRPNCLECSSSRGKRSFRLLVPPDNSWCARSLLLLLKKRDFTNICAVARPECCCYSISVVLLLLRSNQSSETSLEVLVHLRKDMVSYVLCLKTKMRRFLVTLDYYGTRSRSQILHWKDETTSGPIPVLERKYTYAGSIQRLKILWIVSKLNFSLS